MLVNVVFLYCKTISIHLFSDLFPFDLFPFLTI